MNLHVALLLGAFVCAILCVRSKPLTAALWLAVLSAFMAILFFRLGAPEIAVIELSVGAGLITVILAFAISMAEDEATPRSLLPRPIAGALVVLACVLLLWLILPRLPIVVQSATLAAPFVVQLWNYRILDVVIQLAIVVAGVIGVLSLLGETRASRQEQESRPGEVTQ